MGKNKEEIEPIEAEVVDVKTAEVELAEDPVDDLAKEEPVQTKALAKKQKSDITVDAFGKMVPKNADEAFRAAKALHEAGVVPKSHKTAMETFAVVQLGASLGLNTFDSFRGIALINGMPSLHTDAPLKLVLASGTVKRKIEYFFGKDGTPLDEKTTKLDDIIGAYCEMERLGVEGVHTGVYKIEEAKKAGLMGKPDMPWSKHAKVMLKRRARSFVLKDLWADVLGGTAIAEYDNHALPEKGFEGDYKPATRIETLNDELKTISQ